MNPQPANIPRWSLLAAWLLLSLGQALAQPFAINWFAIAGGGGSGSDGTHSVSGTIGQTDAGGPLTNAQFSVAGGFWVFIQDNTPPMFLAPRLEITLVSGQARVFWLTNVSGFILQSNGSVVQPAGWADVSGTPGVTGSNFFLDFPPIGTTRFFRLRWQ
jgi:hypothetical protein